MKKVRFIYTGSIGLNHTVATLNASAFVNDLSTVEIEPLSVVEGKQLIGELMLHKSIKIDDGTIDHLLQKTSWLLPFHIQLAIQEISELCRVSKVAGIEEIDKAFDNMVASRNNNHFEHYYSRLKAQFKKEAYRYAEALLQDLATKGTITSADLYNQAVGFGVQDQYRQILEVLMYDGYINNVGDGNTYQFNSPVVRLWWQRFVCK